MNGVTLIPELLENNSDIFKIVINLFFSIKWKNHEKYAKFSILINQVMNFYTEVMSKFVHFESIFPPKFTVFTYANQM